MDAPPVEHYDEPATRADMAARCIAMANAASQPCVTFINEGEVCLALLKPDLKLETWHCYPHLQVKSDYI